MRRKDKNRLARMIAQVEADIRCARDNIQLIRRMLEKEANKNGKGKTDGGKNRGEVP